MGSLLFCVSYVVFVANINTEVHFCFINVTYTPCLKTIISSHYILARHRDMKCPRSFVMFINVIFKSADDILDKTRSASRCRTQKF